MFAGHNPAVAGFSTPGGVAADLTILASTLLTLAGLLFLLYVLAVVAGIVYGTIARRGEGR